MRNRNTLIAVAAGILFGALAFYLIHLKEMELERRTTPVQVLVASRYIPARSRLTEGMYQRKSVPELYVSPSALRDPGEVERLVTLVPISAGEQILSNKFGLAEDSLATGLSPGFRAFTLDVSEAAGVGHLLRPGDRVDLLVKLSPNAKQQATAFLLQNIQVLAVGQKLNGTKSPRKNGEGEERELFRQTEEAASAYNHVTLALTPAEAETLFALEGSNLVKLVLRAPGDDEIVSIPKKSEAEVFSKLGVPYSPGPGKTKLKHGLAGSPPEEAP